MSENRFKDLRELKEYLKERVALADLVARHTKLVKDPRGFKACCPFPDHNEKTPSFNIDVSKNLFYCYGCQRGGDIFSFLEAAEGLPFIEALKELADEHDLKLPSPKGGSNFNKSNVSYSQSKDVFKLIERCSEFYHRQLMEGSGEKIDAAQEYLMKRGITPEQVETYQLGWAPGSGWDLCNKLSDADKQLAVKAGVIREYNSKVFDFFQDRLMIPIRDHRGRTLAFSGRTLEEVTSKNPKYKNSPESDYFKKKEVLYGLYQCMQSIRSKDYVVICEGFFDQWALNKLEIPSVAVMGTALTENHANILKRYCSEVVLFMDSDKAGLASVLRSLPVLFACDLDVKVFVAKEVKDPDEWLASKAEAPAGSIENQLRSSQEGLEWWGDRILQEGDSQSLNHVQLMKRLAPVWSCARSQAHRQVLALRFSSSVGMTAREFYYAMNSISESPMAERQLPPQRSSSVRGRASMTPRDKGAEELMELWIRGWTLLTPKTHDGWDELEELFRGTDYAVLVQKISKEYFARNGELSGRDLSVFIDNEDFPDEQKNKLLRCVFDSDAISDAQNVGKIQKSFEELKDFFKDLNRKHEIQQLQKKIEMAVDGSEESEQLLHRISKLLKKDNKCLEVEVFKTKV